MLQSFVIVLREGFEAFLIVALAATYLRRTGRRRLTSAVHCGIVAAVLGSAGLGLVLRDVANLPLWEGILGLVTIPLVVGLVVHMWRAGPRMRRDIEVRLGELTVGSSTRLAWWSVFAFTAFMIAREGMETALLLFQVQGALLAGATLGLAGAAATAVLWTRVGHALDLQRFFQVTGIFLLLFTVQIVFGAFHELAEAGVLPNSAVLHAATEPYAPEGRYGRWLAFLTAAVPAVWLSGVWLRERVQTSVAFQAGRQT